MIINGPVLLPKSGGAEQPNSVSPPGVQGNRKEAVHSRDEASFSVDKGKVQELEAKLVELPEVRQERVQALQLAVREGRYQVSDEQLAQAMFAELLAPTPLR
jgi:flagellar biosynthesis anti-sigma factor FlgM